MVSVLLLNYMTTGAPADVAPSLWWPIVDLRQMAEQGTLYDYAWATTVRRNSNLNWGLLGGPLDPVLFLVNFGRFDVLETLIVWSIAVVGIFAFCWLFLRRRTFWAVASVGTANASALGVILAFVASIGLFSVGAGMSETVSYVRLTSFMLPLVIAIACIAWQAVIAAIKWPAPLQAALAIFMPPMLAYACLTDAFERQKLTLAKVVTNAVRFAGGQYSIYDANRDQAGWPALPYSTAIYPPMLEAWKSIGPGKRIWTFSVHSYCMLPGCHPEGLYSSTMTKHRTEVLFGSPEEARATLQREGLNYFFIRTAEIREITHCSPLFVADTLADYFDFQWTDGTDALLTWKGQGTAPVSKQWLEKYREATKPHKFLEDCAGQQYFRNAGRALSEAVAQGKRWGREVPMP
jgi:hypothetical protein